MLKQIKILNEEVDFLNTIDTEHVEAMELPFTLNENELRMDTEGDVLSSKTYSVMHQTQVKTLFEL